MPLPPSMTPATRSPGHDAAASTLHMRAALELAAQGIGLTEPNPRVGCVLVDSQGQVIGQGHTQEAGGPHAEVMALRDVANRGHTPQGATAYVTLEPCSHHGRTPPCCDALIGAGIARVVMAAVDPNPLVSGRGAERLRAAGIEVVEGPLSHEARELNIGFFSRMSRGRPWVRLKVAASLDGRTALPDGRSQWITGPDARRDGHAFRKRATALLTGVGTVIDDDPRLDVRLVDTPRQPLRAIVDSRLQTPPGARILQPPGAVLLYTVAEAADRRHALERDGVEIARLPPNPQGKVDLPLLLADLARRGVNELHVEAGARLNGSFVREGLVDELLLYLAPKLLGAGLPIADFGVLSSLDEAPSFDLVDARPVGCDWRFLARRRSP